MSRSTSPASPLDKFKPDAQKGTVKVVWDVEDDDPLLRHQMMTYLHRLVSQTEPNSKLAYQICHYMENNYLEIPGLQDVFPHARKAFKQSQKADLQKRKQMDGIIKDIEADIRTARKAFRKDKDPDLETQIEVMEEQLEGYQADREKLHKEQSYKEVYPIKSAKQAVRGGVDARDWEALEAFLASKIKRKPKNGSNIVANAGILSDHLSFSKQERDALMLILIAEEYTEFGEFMRNLSSGLQKNAHGIVAKMLNIDRSNVSIMFRSDAPLVSKGILIPISDRYDDDDMDDFDSLLPMVSAHLVNVLKEPDMTVESMMKHFVGDPATTHLDWDKDFSYLGEAGDQLISMLRGAKNKQQVGVNFLLFGEPGTGKTEAMKAAAKKLGLDLYIVGERTRFGKEPTRQDRLSAVMLAQELLADKPNAAVMLDEMEDLFPAQQTLSMLFGGSSKGDDDGKEPTGVSKVYLNRLLENNRTVTMWAANNPEKFDPAFRRRIIFSIEFRIPPTNVREKIWENVSARHDFALSAEDRRELASSFVVPPALMSNAIRAASLSGQGMETIRGTLRAASNLMFGNSRAIDARDKVPKHYDPRFLNAKVEQSDFDLSSLARNIKESGKRHFSLLSFGEPGTGKTEFLHYLADYLEMDVMVRDAASLTDKYVGETEKRIEAAFAEAEDRGMFLLIDEADTFLRRRQDLGNNWEVSAVNMMLTCMQRHPQPFGCTTNLYNEIDPAAKRRFLFKVAFHAMTPEQSQQAFKHFFGRDCPPELAKACTGLAPSDFVNVKKQAEFIARDVTDEDLIRMLAAEAKARKDDQRGDLYSGSPKFLGLTPG